MAVAFNSVLRNHLIRCCHILKSVDNKHLPVCPHHSQISKAHVSCSSSEITAISTVRYAAGQLMNFPLPNSSCHLSKLITRCTSGAPHSAPLAGYKAFLLLNSALHHHLNHGTDDCLLSPFPGVNDIYPQNSNVKIWTWRYTLNQTWLCTRVQYVGGHVQIPAAWIHTTVGIRETRLCSSSSAVIQYAQKANCIDPSCKSWLLKRSRARRAVWLILACCVETAIQVMHQPMAGSQSQTRASRLVWLMDGSVAPALAKPFPRP